MSTPFGALVKARRARLAMQQQTLRRKAGLSLKQMSAIENHDVSPRLATVLKLAEALHLDLGDLNVLLSRTPD